MQTITIEVLGGVPHVASPIPKGITLRIIDYDVDGEEGLTEDNNGDPCVIQEYIGGSNDSSCDE